MSYSAIVSRITVRPHPNADRLQLGTCHGNQVVVGLDTKDGDLGVFFASDGRLSDAMLTAGDLVGRTNPETGKHEGGFFPANGRVRSQSFRGSKSDGYWTPLSSLAWTGHPLASLSEGDTFTELSGHEVCSKYITPATLRAQTNAANNKRKPRVVAFPEHVDTGQFRYLTNLEPEAIVYISEKCHGTSGRYGHVLELTEYPWFWQRWLYGKKREWKHMSGSRRVILGDNNGGMPGPGFYGTNYFRDNVVTGVELHKGEVLYFEIVGYVEGDTPIMNRHAIKDDLKDLKKRYGSVMSYDYGCAQGEHRMLVYRITNLNEDGHAIDLSWSQVVGRCKQLGLTTVMTLVEPFVSDGEDINVLRLMVEGLTDGPSTLDNRHIREGVVVRIEDSNGVTFLKNKSWAFKVLEGIIKDSDTFVDLEEAS
jgi:hypothetical protein